MFHMDLAKKAGRLDQWRCDTYAKPSTVIRHLQVAAGPEFKVYVGLSQVDRPTFLLKDVVVPSSEDWAAIEAKRR